MKDSHLAHSEELLQFYEEFLELQADCTFLCDAVATMVTQDQALGGDDQLELLGFSDSLRDRTQHLRQALRGLYRRAHALAHSEPPEDQVKSYH